MKRTQRAPRAKATNIELSEELYLRAKHRAIDEGVSFKEIVRRALEQYLARRITAKVT